MVCTKARAKPGKYPFRGGPSLLPPPLCRYPSNGPTCGSPPGSQEANCDRGAPHTLTRSIPYRPSPVACHGEVGRGVVRSGPAPSRTLLPDPIHVVLAGFRGTGRGRVCFLMGGVKGEGAPSPPKKGKVDKGKIDLVTEDSSSHGSLSGSGKSASGVHHHTGTLRARKCGLSEPGHIIAEPGYTVVDGDDKLACYPC
jgi:hypothetical protein